MATPIITTDYLPPRECACGFDKLDCSHPCCWAGKAGKPRDMAEPYRADDYDRAEVEYERAEREAWRGVDW